jgi:hypothetical protein
MNIKKLALSLFTAGILASAPINVLALSNYTLNGNYVITGDLYVDSLLGHVGQCLEVGTGPLGASEIVATGSPCGGGGGGGVTSVTAGPSGNLTFAPTTGAVVGDITESPSFTGLTTIGTPGSAASPTTGVLDFGNGAGVTSLSVPASGCLISAINGNALCIQYLGTPKFSMDNNGRLGVQDIFDVALDSSTGDCLEAAGNGEIVSTGAACAAGGGVTSVTSSNALINATPTVGAVVLTGNESPTFTGAATFNSSITGNSTLFVSGLTTVGNLTDTALTINSPVCTNGTSTLTACGGGFPAVQQLHGNQSITAVAAACTPGTPIVFGHTFSAVPDIIMSTSAVVGDSGAPVPGSVTTTGFTPELCSIASNTAATVYWNAVN